MVDIISAEEIGAKILSIRGKRVMLDADLALLYGVRTKRLNEQVKRNKKRFPEDFMFQLTAKEKEEVVAICDHLKFIRFSPYLPLAFTEQGVAMLSGVLNSDRAIKVNIQIMRAFTGLRRMLLTNRDMRRKIEEMEKKYDEQFAVVFQAIRQLLEVPESKPKSQIGFHP
ncbi:MAG: ORF6N domain-containing protein [Candidatus Omnitrophica bacterium]|nr:ORF6N domain-containing protein [Candidatus Omnitrophota bacterium]